MYLPIDTREAESNLVSRATCYDRYYGYYSCRRSAWSRFGRWILAGILIFIALFFLFVIMCITRRRRRRNQIVSTNQPMAYQTPSNNYPPASNDYYAPQGQQQYAPPAGKPPYHNDNATYGVTQPQNVYTTK
ncbi:hypothetical protein ACMFMG_007399 [Clarireedia jacksonii]